MKQRIRMIFLCAALVCLTGCAAKLPAAAADGAPWSEDWTTLGQTLGVEATGYGLTLRDNKAARNMCFAAWSIGEAQPYTNADGEETDLYDAQLVVLLSDAGSAEGARASVDEWLELAADNYAITDTAQQTYNGQTFTVLTYTFPSGTSSFARGISAFTAYGGCAISAEFACRDNFAGDAGEILEDFLDHCHYAVPEGNP